MAEQTRSVCASVGSITVTPFGVDLDAFRPGVSEEGAHEEVIRIGTVKTLARKYGIDVLIDAVSAVRDALQEEDSLLAEHLRLLIVGGGPDRERLEQKVRNHELDNITRFVGKVPHEEVPHYLNKLDVYVAASRQDSESFGVAVLEASACGLPVVVSDVGGLPEVVKDEETGLIVPREDPEATAAAILRLIRNPKLRKDMGEAGRAWVRDQYSWPACVDRMETVYEELTT